MKKTRILNSVVFALLIVAVTAPWGLIPAPVHANPAYPTVEATNHSVEGSDTTSHTVSLPANIQAGETLLVFFAHDSASDRVSFPGGWTEIFDATNLAIAWRKADGGEGASITVTTDNAQESAHISYRISGATDPTSTPPEVTNGAAGYDTNPDPDSLSPTGGSKEYLWIAVAGSDDGRDEYTAYPTNYNDNQETYQSAESSAGCNVAVATKENETDAEDPSAFTIEGPEGWIACTVAVYPEEGADPPTVTTQAATSVEETTATGNGNITDTGGENCDERGFDWDTDSGAPYANSATDSGNYTTGAYTKSLTSLPAGTTIYCRAKAHNSGGWGYGSEVTFYTKPTDPTNLTDTDQEYNSIDLSWTKGTGAEKTMIRYRTDQYPTGTSDGTQGYYDTGSSTTVSGLSAGQIYYFRAWAWDTNAGYSDSYSQDTAYTLPGDPSAFSATTASDTQIDLGWTKGTGGDKTMVRRKEGSYPTGPADGTQVYFDTGSSYPNVGLDPSTTYFYRAWAYDSDSTYYSSGYSGDSATTYGSPSMSTNDATSIEETYATLSGNITSTNGANATERGFQWDTDSGAPYSENWTEIGSFGTGAFTHLISSLTKGELYYYRSLAYNTYGWGYGSEVTFLTKPDTPTGFTAVAGNATRIDLSWTKGAGALNTYIRGKDGSYPTDRADGYLVYNDTGTSTSDDGLIAGHTYYYKAWSYATEGGKEQYSDQYDFTFGDPEMDLVLWIEWEYDTTFTDLSGNSHDATPSFRTASSDEHVSAELTMFLPIEEAQAPAWSLDTTPGALMGTTTTTTGNFSTTPTPTSTPFVAVIEAVSTATATPSQLPFTIIAGFIIVAMSLGMSYLMKKNNASSLILKLVVIVSLFGIFIAVDVFDFWMLVFFLIPAVAIIMLKARGQTV